MSASACLCGHRLDWHDEYGVCRPRIQIGASQGMGPIHLGSCDCRELLRRVMTWERSGFVHVTTNVPTTEVPSFINTLWIQVAFGIGPPSSPLDQERLAQLRARGIRLLAWVWCTGEDVEGEARFHREAADSYDALCVNMEEPYDAHGDQTNDRYFMPDRYLDALNWDERPLGLTTTPAFGSDMTAWVEREVCYMPQAFTNENGYSITRVVTAALDWGWPLHLIRPLVQAYNPRPSVESYRYDADLWGVGVIPYTVEQALTDIPAGTNWMNEMEPLITRPNPQPEESPMTLIGANHGATAAANRWRNEDPGGTKLKRNADGSWPSIDTLPPDLATWGAYDKLERSLKIVFADHDAQQ